jgi:hypothetical protein
MAVTPLEHFLWRQYSISVKNWLISKCHLNSYPEDNNVTVVYTTPERAWSKYVYPVINGATVSPNINFRLTNMEYLTNENILGFVKDYKQIGESNKIKELRPPLIYRLTYHATIYTRVQSEMDILLYQILSNAHQNKKAVFIVDDQWAEMKCTDPSDETDLEPGETKDIVNRSGFDLIVMRAYLPLDYTEGFKVSNMVFEYDI